MTRQLKPAKHIALTFGALADPIHEQLTHAGYYLPVMSSLVPYQKLADAITLCSIHGLLTDASTERARKRLLARIVKRAMRLDPRSNAQR